MMLAALMPLVLLALPAGEAFVRPTPPYTYYFFNGNPKTNQVINKFPTSMRNYIWQRIKKNNDFVISGTGGRVTGDVSWPIYFFNMSRMMDSDRVKNASVLMEFNTNMTNKNKSFRFCFMDMMKVNDPKLSVYDIRERFAFISINVAKQVRSLWRSKKRHLFGVGLMTSEKGKWKKVPIGNYINITANNHPFLVTEVSMPYWAKDLFRKTRPATRLWPYDRLMLSQKDISSDVCQPRNVTLPAEIMAETRFEAVYPKEFTWTYCPTMKDGSICKPKALEDFTGIFSIHGEDEQTYVFHKRGVSAVGCVTS